MPHLVRSLLRAALASIVLAASAQAHAARWSSSEKDVKELYYYLDSTPTHSYMRMLYKYPQSEFPYQALVDENRRRGRAGREVELADTGVFDGGRYFDVFKIYCEVAPL